MGFPDRGFRDPMSEEKNAAITGAPAPPAWDHSSREQFFDHYAKKSNEPYELEKFRKIRETILRIIRQRKGSPQVFEVLDVGCAAGTQCMVWAELGHRVHGLDVNEPLIQLARQRSAASGLDVDYQLGSALRLPWPDKSIDVCLSLELLEHVAEWQGCLKEFARVLRPGGVMFLATSNKLCPKQFEFNLPAFSWYPAALKQYFLNLAMTKRPELANHATYPAVNWFTPYSLREALAKLNFESMDRFDLIDTGRKSPFVKLLISATRSIPPLRWLGHVCTPGTVLLALRKTQSQVFGV
jgi:2-polyprenyl-3-methyl-5-hydroxy-6-metoxy-1,4-benzoquinol methylase